MAGNTKVGGSKPGGPHPDEFVVDLTTDVNMEQANIPTQTSAYRGTADYLEARPDSPKMCQQATFSSHEIQEVLTVKPRRSYAGCAQPISL